MAEQKSFTKIKVDGRIHLGHRRELLQAPIEKLTSLFRAGGAGPKHKYDKLSTENIDMVGEALEFKISEEDAGELYIEDAGLVTSYGIFGAPGCGKTVLLMHLLEQLLKHESSTPSKRYGALILDPKASLVEDITTMAKNAGRYDDLRIIGTGEKLNVIDCELDPYELGAILVLAGRSAGIDASDPFWFQEWSNLFASSLSLLRADAFLNTSLEGVRPVTLKLLLDSIFNEVDADDNAGYPSEHIIQRLARVLKKQLDELEDRRDDIFIDIQQIERFFSRDYVGTIEAFISKAFGMFRQSRNRYYSDDTPRGEKPPFYEDIIENGRIVVISISPSEPVLAKTLCTLVKCLFQRTVLARGEGHIKNKVRPLVIACDEYSEIASEVPGQSMGDGQFLALARQYGCMAIFATQSVNVLQASSLKETWRSVFSNFAAKIYMRLADNETAEEATKLAGESDWRVLSRGSSLGQQGRSVSKQRELHERKNLPSNILTQVLKTGQAVVIGALDGGRSIPGTRFLSVPFNESESPGKITKGTSPSHKKLINCPECKYYNKPPELQLTSSPKANLKWEETKEERRGEEQRRVDENYQFHYKPEFFDWCSKNVPPAEQLKKLRDCYRNGDSDAIEQARKDGLLFTIDPSKSTVDPIYPLCIKLNAESNCNDFKARKKTHI